MVSGTTIIPDQQSLTEKALAQIVRHTVRAIIRRFGLNRDWIIGLIGERGSGKSLGGANVAVRDFGMNCEPLYSNMQIALGVNIPDQAAATFGVPGGEVLYKSEYIDKQAFLALDSRYEGGCLFFDEFNLEYGEARRSSANVNLMTDKAIQQLRKLQCGLVYTVINEAYVDVRIRESTDLFIRCSDVAFKPLNLQQGMTQGVEYEWMLYAMSEKVFGKGRTYADTHQPFGPIRITLGGLWGICDTMERQAQGAMKYSDTNTKSLIPIEPGEDPKVVVHRNRWGWLDERLKRFWDNHATDGPEIVMTSQEFAHELQVPKEQWAPVARQLDNRIADLYSEGLGWTTRIYHIPNRTLEMEMV